MVSKKIKIAIIVNEKIFSWQANLIEKISNLEIAEITVILIKSAADSCLLPHNKNNIIYKLHNTLDRLINKNQKTSYTKEIHGITLNSGFLNNSKINIQYQNNSIKDDKIDLVINLTGFSTEVIGNFQIKYGIINFNIGDHRLEESFSNAYVATVLGLPEVTGLIYHQIHSNSLMMPLCYFGISSHSFSISINRENITNLSIIIILRIIKGIYNDGYNYLELLQTRRKSPIKNDIFPDIKQRSNTCQDLYNLSRLIIKYIKTKIWNNSNNKWHIIYKFTNSFEKENNISEFNYIQTPEHIYLADPFIIYQDNSYYVFFEEFDINKNKGHISYLKIDDRGNKVDHNKILDKTYHLSYPHIFELDGTFYMIPETKQNGTIELYRCTAFPDRWEFVMNLMTNLSAVDTTVFFHNGLWWLFTSIDDLKNPDISFNELFLFYSKDIFTSEWTSHPQNPVNSSLKSSRSAGKIFFENNALIRPSQDCSGSYGKAVIFNHITELTITNYEEKIVSRLELKSDEKIIGIHTFNSQHNLMVLDILKEDYS